MATGGGASDVVTGAGASEVTAGGGASVVTGAGSILVVVVGRGGSALVVVGTTTGATEVVVGSDPPNPRPSPSPSPSPTDADRSGASEEVGMIVGIYVKGKQHVQSHIRIILTAWAAVVSTTATEDVVGITEVASALGASVEDMATPPSEEDEASPKSEPILETALPASPNSPPTLKFCLLTLSHIVLTSIFCVSCSAPEYARPPARKIGILIASISNMKIKLKETGSENNVEHEGACPENAGGKRDSNLR